MIRPKIITIEKARVGVNRYNMINLLKIREFAFTKHANQVRPNKACEPKTVHISQVAVYVRKGGGSDTAIAAAYLHDTVEDTDTKLSEIIEKFGIEVALIVDELTDPPEFESMALDIRKHKQSERIKSAHYDTKLVKVADQLSNIESVYNDPPLDWDNTTCLQYVMGAKKIVDACQGTNAYLEDLFNNMYTLNIQKYSQ